MSRLVQVDQRELDALRAVYNAAKHFVNVPSGISTRAGHGELAAHMKRQNSAWRDLKEAVEEVPR